MDRNCVKVGNIRSETTSFCPTNVSTSCTHVYVIQKYAKRNKCACKQLRRGSLHKETGDAAPPHLRIEALQIVLSHESSVMLAGCLSKFDIKPSIGRSPVQCGSELFYTKPSNSSTLNHVKRKKQSLVKSNIY